MWNHKSQGKKVFQEVGSAWQNQIEHKSDMMMLYMNLLYLAVRIPLGFFMRKKMLELGYGFDH